MPKRKKGSGVSKPHPYQRNQRDNVKPSGMEGYNLFLSISPQHLKSFTPEARNEYRAMLQSSIHTKSIETLSNMAQQPVTVGAVDQTDFAQLLSQTQLLSQPQPLSQPQLLPQPQLLSQPQQIDHDSQKAIIILRQLGFQVSEKQQQTIKKYWFYRRHRSPLSKACFDNNMKALCDLLITFGRYQFSQDDLINMISGVKITINHLQTLLNTGPNNRPILDDLCDKFQAPDICKLLKSGSLDARLEYFYKIRKNIFPYFQDRLLSKLKTYTIGVVQTAYQKILIKQGSASKVVTRPHLFAESVVTQEAQVDDDSCSDLNVRHTV